MGRKRKCSPSATRDAQAEVREEAEGLVVVWKGYKKAPDKAPPRRVKHCPRCGWGPASSRERYAVSEAAEFYFCRRCAEDTRPTRWKEPK